MLTALFRSGTVRGLVEVTLDADTRRRVDLEPPTPGVCQSNTGDKGCDMTEIPKAIGLIRREVTGRGADIHVLAEQHGYRLVFSVVLDIGPLVSALVIAQHIYEHNAGAVIVPGFEHVDSVRHIVTDLAALITPMCIYPRGYRWPLRDLEDRR